MPRPKNSAPSIRYHISGQSIVTLGGRTFYLGKHGSSEAIARYAVLIDEYQKTGLELSEDFDIEAIFARAEALLSPAPRLTKEHQADEPVRVKDVCECFRKHAVERFKSQQAERFRINQLCDELIARYGDVLATDFGPKRLKELQRIWVERDWSRPYINRMLNSIKRMFSFVVSEELVTVEVYQRLRTVEALRYGATEAREPEERKPVPLVDVRKTATELSPVIRDMLRVLLGTGMRPSEVCRMRPCDIERSGDVWFYRPKRHKTANKGKAKSVPLLDDAKAAVTNYLNRPADAYLFNPAEAVAWHNAKLRSERKTKVQPSQVCRKKSNPQTQPGDCYTAHSLRRAIDRACIRAAVKSWTPYQLRHLVASEVRQALGLEQTQALLGHHHKSMTEHYARLAEQQAVEAARVAPKL
jgi:integrase